MTSEKINTETDLSALEPETIFQDPASENLFIETKLFGYDNYAVWQEVFPSPEEFSHLSNKKKLDTLAKLGHLAPSSHNTQPWQFVIDEDSKSIEIDLNRDRVIAMSDTKGRQACLSLGAAIGFIEIAGKHLGYNPEISYMNLEPESVKPIDNKEILMSGSLSKIPAVQISFTNSIPLYEYEAYYQAIPKRRANRSSYDKEKPLPKELENELSQFLLDGVGLKFLTRKGTMDTLKIASIAELQKQADGFVLNNQMFRDEMGQWMHESPTRSYLGMPTDTFGLTGEFAGEFISRLKSGTLNSSDIAGFQRKSLTAIESTPTIGVVTVDEQTPYNWIGAGRVLGKVILCLESHGLASAFHAGLAEASEYGYGIVNSLLRLQFGLKEDPVILFRAGFSKENESIPPHAPRLPFSNVIIDARDNNS